MFSCQICKIFQSTYLEELLRTTSSKHRSSFLEVFCRTYCSALINAVMKYDFSAAVVQSWRVLHRNLLKIALHHSCFSKNFSELQNSDIEKCLLMAASEDEFILEIFLHGCFSKQLQTYIPFRNSYTYFTFLTLTSCERGTDFYDFFLGKSFGKKCKHTELALNFVQKQNFS